MATERLLIFVIRHGRTALNVKKVFRGHLDGPLDNIGINQAELTGELLKSINLNTIYTSPLERAVQTAEIIGKHQNNDVQVVPEEGCKDLTYGQWEGKTYEEAKEEYPEIYEVWKKDPRKAVIPGAETLPDAKKRVWGTLENIIANNTLPSIAVVSHRVVNKLLLTSMLGLSESDFWKIQQDTCCVNIIEYKKGEFTILKLNHSTHVFDFDESLNVVDF